MRHILVINPKGGCGKTTIATNLAAAYASDGFSVALADFDPQHSSLGWLDRRPDDAPPIVGLDGYNNGLVHSPRQSDFLIIDAPAGVRDSDLTKLVNRAESILIPVLPSPIDMAATAEFATSILERYKVETKQAKLALVANRAKENTRIYEQLEEFLRKQKMPHIATLRDAQNYNRAYTRGLGVFELPEYLAWPDWEQWEPLLKWLDSRRSQAKDI